MHKSLKDVPSELKIEDIQHPPRAHKKTQLQPDLPSHLPPYYFYPPPPPPHSYISPYYPIHHTNQPTLSLHIPSSDPFDPDKEPTLYPQVNDWLAKLDSTARGADNKNWKQYFNLFDVNGYIHIIQIAEDGKVAGGAKELADIMSIPVGIAELIVKYAISDCDKITKKEIRLARERYEVCHIN